MTPSGADKIQRLAYLQMVLYLAIWLFGIYINGFEPSPQETGASSVSFFLSPIVITHFVLGISTAALGFVLLTLGWVYKLKKFVLLMALSLVSITVAATGGLTFVFGIGNQNFDSMLMATGFLTAFYLTFLSLLADKSISLKNKKTLTLSFSVLGLFYVVFLSGMYVNLFVASSVFSEPPAIAQKMLFGMVTSPPALIHEISGVLLLVLVTALTISLLCTRLSKLGRMGIISSLLVAYSLLQGVLSNIAPIFESQSGTLVSQTGLVQAITSVVEPMISAAGFFISIIITMIIAERLSSRKMSH